MDEWVIWLGLVVLVALTLFATLNLALRLPSRVRIAEQFEKAGRGDAFEDFVAVRPRYMLATAVLRAVATLALLLVVLYNVDTADPLARVADTIVA